MIPALPSIFVSHGSPMLAVDRGPTTAFLAALGRVLARPRAVLAVSAHWDTAVPALGTVAAPDTIHDFGGFPPELYRLRYPAPGAPDLARRAASLLEAAGFATAADPRRGLDHGAWVPLLHMYPAHDVPVAQLSIQAGADAAWHHRVGTALAALRSEGVLVLGSGGITHNLGAVFRSRGPGPAPGWVSDFTAWMHAALAGGRLDEVLDWERAAPEARANHPTDEHLLPLFVALGAGGRGAPAVRVHSAHEYPALALDAYLFGDGAPECADRLAAEGVSVA